MIKRLLLSGLVLWVLSTLIAKSRARDSEVSADEATSDWEAEGGAPAPDSL